MEQAVGQNRNCNRTEQWQRVTEKTESEFGITSVTLKKLSTTYSLNKVCVLGRK